LDCKLSHALAQEIEEVLIRFRRLGLQHKESNSGIRPSEMMMLTTLVHHVPFSTKGAKITDLGTLLQITPAAVTHIIDTLVEKGFVERLGDPADRRIVLIKPTAKGLATVASFVTRFNQKCVALAEYLGEQDSRELIRLLNLSLTFFYEHRGQ
jgi:DNA-binding MarR family transcriptional regulator